MTDKLLNCPFCGGEAKVRETGYRKWDGSHRRFYIVECQCCCANIEADTKEAAIVSWNNRRPMDRIVEQLEECSVTYCREYGYAEDENVLYLPDAIGIVKGVQNE